MLEKVLELLASGPIETKMGIHGVNVMVTKNVRIVSADQIGIVVQMKGSFGGGYGDSMLYPWSSVMFIGPEGLSRD